MNEVETLVLAKKGQTDRPHWEPTSGVLLALGELAQPTEPLHTLPVGTRLLFYASYYAPEDLQKAGSREMYHRYWVPCEITDSQDKYIDEDRGTIQIPTLTVGTDTYLGERKVNQKGETILTLNLKYIGYRIVKPEFYAALTNEPLIYKPINYGGSPQIDINRHQLWYGPLQGAKWIDEGQPHSLTNSEP